MTKTNVVFLMAGEGSRFGYKFKPFMKLGDQTFIEHAVEPFYKWKDNIDNVYFIFRKDQERHYDVSSYLKTNILFSEDKIKPIIIDKKTKGPRNTICEALKKENINNAIICDCDHKINVDSLFKKILEIQFEKVVVPVWKISQSESSNWSKIVLKDDKIVDILEKQSVDFTLFQVWGILGCIYFPDLKRFQNNRLNEYVSDVIKDIFLSEDPVTFSKINDAYFFGDPEMLKACVEKRRNECSFFFDVDGVLLEHKDNSTNCLEDNTPLKENINLLRELKKHNHKIILTTARSTKYKKDFVKLLEKLAVPYDHLVTGLASGPRFLINDRKPSKPFTTQANSFENFRNEPLDITIKNILSSNEHKILKDLSANSGASTFLIQNETGKKFIRKCVNKNIADSDKHISTLKRQFKDLERFNFFINDVCPETLCIVENNLQCYYDMEYLEDFYKLDNFPKNTKKHVLTKIINDLKGNVYCYNKKLHPQDARENFNNFISDKIIKKLNLFSSKDKDMKKIISSEDLKINGIPCKNLMHIFNLPSICKFTPSTISPVHGDLTLENILYNIITDTYKLIDMDGSKYMDTHKLDLGKLSQSILARYSEWSLIDPDISVDGNNFVCNPEWFEADDESIELMTSIMPFSSDTLEECIFYMCTYFIRFTPFRLKMGRDHGIFALLMATMWLNKLNFGD
jgi:molybdopterin-guanine dinucleotide biosynthesis protein A